MFGTVSASDLESVLNLEYRDWITHITAICGERDRHIDELRRQASNRASPEGALALGSRPVRLDALRKCIDIRLQLRAEYARNIPALLGYELLSTLRADLERFVESGIKDDPRSLPEAEDILAAMRVGIDKMVLTRPMQNSTTKPPTQDNTAQVFISYSWDSEDHKVWVRDFATCLRSDGIEVTLDQWHLELGGRSPEFMERSVRESSSVLVVCTEKYKHRFDDRKGGAGYEGHIITGEIISEVGQNKFIPVLRSGDWGASMPTALRGTQGVDLRDGSESEYRRLVKHLHGASHIPGVGPRPHWLHEPAPAAQPEPNNVSRVEPHSAAAPSAEDMPLCQEKRDDYLVIWLRNDSLDPITPCRIVLNSLRRYSEKHRDFYRNPFTSTDLTGAHTIKAGQTSEGVAIARCSDVKKRRLTIHNTSIEISEGGTWLAVLGIEWGAHRRNEHIFFEWIPGEAPAFISDPRIES
jgi:hypothetical protein